MPVRFIIMMVVFALASLGLIGAILLQKKRDAGGVGSIAGMGQVESEKYWSNSNTIDGTLERWTKIGGVVLGLLAILISMM